MLPSVCGCVCVNVCVCGGWCISVCLPVCLPVCLSVCIDLNEFPSKIRRRHTNGRRSEMLTDIITNEIPADN